MAIKTVQPSQRRCLWVADDLWDRVVSAARADDRTVSSWVRQVLELAVKKTKDQR